LILCAGGTMNFDKYIGSDHEIGLTKFIVRERLLKGHREAPPYANIFLMEYYDQPLGGKLGDWQMTLAQNGSVWCVGPGYTLPARTQGLDVNKVALSVVHDAFIMAACVHLTRNASGQFAWGNKQVMLIATNEATAHDPNGKPCPNVTQEAAAWARNIAPCVLQPTG